MPFASTPDAAAIPPRVASGRLLAAWLLVGAQSFGGGLSTMTLIQRVFVEQYGWITDADYVQALVISQMSPGINILGITSLIGHRLGGARGVAVSLAGLLAPSVLITMAMTAGYAAIRHLAWIHWALRAVVPATIGIGLLTAWSLARTLLGEAVARGSRAEWIVSAATLAVSAGLIALRAPVAAVLCAGGLVMGAMRALSSRRDSRAEQVAVALGEASAEARGERPA